MSSRPAPAVPPTEAVEGVLVRVRSGLAGFTGALRRVAEQVLADPSGAARSTIVDLAERSGTSPATVTRFCRALGFDGYADLRLEIAAETGRVERPAGWSADVDWPIDIQRGIGPDDPLDRVLHQVMAADTLAVQDTATVLDLRSVERAAQAISQSSRVDIYGTSGCSLVGAELQFCLHRIGVPAWSWTDVPAGCEPAARWRQEGEPAASGRHAGGDVALAVSHTGHSPETVDVLAEAGSRGATTVALTSSPSSALAGVADIVLLTAVRSAPFRTDTVAVRHPQLVVLDLLYIAVAQRVHERAHAAFQLTARAVDAHRAANQSLSDSSPSDRSPSDSSPSDSDPRRNT